MNKRFYFDRCKFTLKPGQSLSHYKGGPDEEGYWYEEFTLSYDGESVTAEISSGGRDCDGRIDNYVELILMPDGWEKLDSQVYDQYAQLSNY